MLDRLRWVSLISSVILLLASAQAQKVTRDITYTIGDETAQLGDLYEPAGNGPFPAIIYIHGGSWRSGNKKIYRRIATDLAAKGYAGFAINYDLHAHSFPTSFEEAQAAVRFIRKHAAEYHVDPNQIVIAGDSAGGEIAALVALIPEGPSKPEKNFAQAADDTSAAVSAAIIFNGVYRLSSDEFGYVYVIGRYLGFHCRVQPEHCKDAEPLEHIHPGDPPFFVGHGTSDHTVPYGEAELFIHALQEQHVPVSTYVANGGRHSYWKKNDFYAPNLAAVETFLAGALHPTITPAGQ